MVMTLRCALLAQVLLWSPAESRWKGRHECPAEISEGPADADVEIRLGNLPVPEPGQPVYLYWWAAKKSAVSYSPLTNPHMATVIQGIRNGPRSEVYPSGPEDPEYNGGQVLISSAGEATIRVRAPSTYLSHRGHSAAPRAPHVHFQLCGASGGGSHRKLKLAFGAQGPYLRGGCHRSSGSTLSYTILSARDASSSSPAGNASAGGGATQEVAVSAADQDPESQDWDALEFSSVYACLTDDKFYDQVASACTTECPTLTTQAHRQCVRPEVVDEKIKHEVAWRLSLDCNEKCWADTVPAALHESRLALADHLDIAWQETGVHLRKIDIDASIAPQVSHARLTVVARTKRLTADGAGALLQAFIANATDVSRLLGLTVHEIETVDSDADPDAMGVDSDTGDGFEVYYPHKDKNEGDGVAMLGGVNLPVPVIISMAVGSVLFFVGSVAILRCLRQRRAVAANNGKAAEVDMAESAKKVEDADLACAA